MRGTLKGLIAGGAQPWSCFFLEKGVKKQHFKFEAAATSWWGNLSTCSQVSVCLQRFPFIDYIFVALVIKFIRLIEWGCYFKSVDFDSVRHHAASCCPSVLSAYIKTINHTITDVRATGRRPAAEDNS